MKFAEQGYDPLCCFETDEMDYWNKADKKLGYHYGTAKQEILCNACGGKINKGESVIYIKGKPNCFDCAYEMEGIGQDEKHT